jgi:hypothetical protein
VTGSNGDAISGWTFRGRGFFGQPDAERSWLPESVEAALRVAPAGAGSVRWTLASGPRPEARLEASSPPIATWLDSAFLEAYPPQTWSPSEVSWSPARPARVGRAYPDPLGPFRSAPDGGRPWIELLLGQLRTLPYGMRTVFELSPAGTLQDTRSARWSGELAEQPSGFRLSSPPLAVRATSDRLEERRQAVVWTLCCRIEVFPPLSEEDPAVDRMAEIVTGASRRDGGSGIRFVRSHRWRAARPAILVLTTAEIAMLFPRSDCPFRTVAAEPNSGARPLVVGAGAGGRPTRVWVEPDQGRHLLVLGETGMGKSTLLVRLAAQAARFGGVLLFDPIGDTGRRLLAALPTGRRGQVLWVSPTRSPIAVNALTGRSGAHSSDPIASERAIENLVLALRRVRSQRYGETPFWGPRIEETARRALAAAAALPGGTIVEAERLLAEPARRPRGVPPEAQEAFDALRQRAIERPEEVDGARRLLGEIASNGVLRRMLCAPTPRCTVAQWVAPGRITVLTGEATEIGESTARYLLAVQLALAWSELMARPRAAKVFVALDEAQWYAHDSVAEILRMGRRANVHLWLSTQALAALPETVAEASRTNAADLVQFRGSPAEVRELHRWVPGVTEESVLALSRGESLVLRGKGEAVEWANTPLAGAGIPDPAVLAMVAEAGRSLWPREEDEGGPSEGGSRPPADAWGGPDARPLWLALRVGAEELPSGSRLEVVLADLRSRFDPSGERLRRWGSLLAQRGCMDAPFDGARGRLWRLRVDALRAELPRPGSPEEAVRASDDWRTLGRPGAPSP